MTMALEDATNPMQGVSGPGKFAKRTDLSYQSQGYGDAAAMQQQMQGAPLAKSPDVRGATSTSVRQAAANAVTPLFAPTERTNEPITSGAPIGAGPGPESLMINQSVDTPEEQARLLSYLPALEAAAQAPNSSQAFRNYVRMLRANL